MPIGQNLPPPRLCGTKVNNRKVYRFFVLRRTNDSRSLSILSEKVYEVLSHTANDAVNYVRDLDNTIPETEIVTYGPKGGRYFRFIGWPSAIENQMLSNWKKEKQYGFQDVI